MCVRAENGEGEGKVRGRRRGTVTNTVHVSALCHHCKGQGGGAFCLHGGGPSITSGSINISYQSVSAANKKTTHFVR